MALYYLSTAADAVRFDTPTYQLYVGGGVPGAPLGYVGPFVSLSGDCAGLHDGKQWYSIPRHSSNR